MKTCSNPEQSLECRLRLISADLVIFLTGLFEHFFHRLAKQHGLGDVVLDKYAALKPEEGRHFKGEWDNPLSKLQETKIMWENSPVDATRGQNCVQRSPIEAIAAVRHCVVTQSLEHHFAPLEL